MKTRNLLILAAVGVVFYLVKKSRDVAAINFSLAKFNVDLKNKALRIGLGISNPSGTSVDVKSISGSLFLSGKEVATVESFKTVTIAPNAKTIVDLKLTPTLFSIWQLLKGSVKGGKLSTSNLRPTFEGSANVQGINIPIKTSLA